MIVIKNDTEIDFDKYYDYLITSSTIYMDVDRVNRALQSSETRLRALLNATLREAYSELSYLPSELSKGLILDVLDRAGAPDSFVKKKSIAQPALIKLIQEKVKVDFCEFCMEFSSEKTYNSDLTSFYNKYGTRGEAKVKINYDLNPTKNLRFSTRNPNVIGYRRELQEAIVPPSDEYYILSADMPQIDGRVAMALYFKTDLTVDLMDQITDTYLVFRELSRNVAHLKDLDTVKEAKKSKEFVDLKEVEKRIEKFISKILPFSSVDERDIYKVIALSTVYRSVSDIEPDIQRYKHILSRNIGYIGRYSAYITFIPMLYQIKYPMYSVTKFGFRQPVMKEKEYSQLNAMMNSPIQTTSSQIVAHTTNTIINRFREKGYSHEDFRVCLVRHDEPVFYIKKSVLHKEIGLLHSCKTIAVEGMKPFKLEWLAGENYLDHNEELGKLLNNYTGDDKEAELLYKSWKYNIEPETINIPDIVNLSYRLLPNGKLYIVITKATGDLEQNVYYFDGYRDNRTLEYKLITMNVSVGNIDENSIVGLTENILKDVKLRNEVLILVENKFASDNVAKYILHGKDVYFTRRSVRNHSINKVILATIILKECPDFATAEDKRNAKYADYYRKRLVRITK